MPVARVSSGRRTINMQLSSAVLAVIRVHVLLLVPISSSSGKWLPYDNDNDIQNRSWHHQVWGSLRPAPTNFAVKYTMEYLWNHAISFILWNAYEMKSVFHGIMHEIFMENISWHHAWNIHVEFHGHYLFPRSKIFHGQTMHPWNFIAIFTCSFIG